VTAPAPLRQPPPPSHQDRLTLVPASGERDWNQWVSATRTRNYVLEDTLADWLERYGEAHGFQRDEHAPGYDKTTDFLDFMFEKGRAFEAAVLRLLGDRQQVVRIASSPDDSRDPAMAQRTLEAMKAGVEIIHSGVLHDVAHQTYGMPDLLVRADVLEKLVPSVYTLERERRSKAPGSPDPVELEAPALPHRRHYRVVDAKFTTLDLNRHWELGNGGSSTAYKVQLFLYNRALGAAQGLLPPAAFLLGRGWKKGTKAEARGNGCFDRLAPVFQDSLLDDEALEEVAERAVQWIRRMRTEGRNWTVAPPSVPELRPNMKQADAPWLGAQKRIAADTGELTRLWQLGLGKRNALLERVPPITRWDDPALSAEVAGITGDSLAARFNALLEVNRDIDGPVARPARVTTREGEWRVPDALEFFVDFETVSDVDDDFSTLPDKGGQPLIFMVGCAHVEGGQLRFRCFVADALTPDAEARMLDAWFGHMGEVRQRLGFAGSPKVFHWSPAEDTSFNSDYSSARQRHPGKEWPEPSWFDFLHGVVKKEPFVVRGAFGFGLKAIGKALHTHGLIQTSWEDGPTDGLGAMVGAWRAAAEAKERGVSLREVSLMRDIEKYNEVDCRVMYEVIDYLRRRH
jgi:hypothetical protein